MGVSGKSIPGSGNSMCKDPEAGAWLLCLRHSESVSASGLESVRKRKRAGDEFIDIAGTKSHKPYHRDFGFYSK